jgi:gliding motility-associated-like protein
MNPAYKPSALDVSNGFANFILSSTNNGACPSIKDSIRLRIMKLPVIDLAKDTVICSSQNPLFIAPVVSGDFGQLQWTTTGTGNFLPGNSSNPIYYDITPDIPLVFVKLTLTSISGGPCGNISAAINVTIRPTPEADFTPSTFTANIPNDPVTFTNKSIKATKYNWNFGDGGTTTAVSPIHDFKATGFYSVTLIATNQYGCADTAVKEITVIGDIQFPNVFTPNQSGANGGIYSKAEYSNDVFFPYATGVTDYDLKIFNRWGELIFQSFDINVGWDGYFNGKLCQQDGYVWKADVKFFDGRTYNKTGSVTLLR